MKKLNNKSIYIKLKMKTIYTGAAFLALMGASSISLAMDEEECANELSHSRSSRMNHIDEKYERVTIEHLKAGDIKLAEFTYNAALEEKSKKMIKSTVQNTLQNSPNFGMENNETQMSPRSLYLKSVELKLDRDLVRSTEYLKKAAELNYPDACYDLAHQYLKGRNGLERSMEHYVKYLQRAERLGNQDAINEVAVLKKSLNEGTQYLDESFKNSTLRKISLGAKTVDKVTHNINLGGPAILAFLDLFYEDKVQTAEYILSFCNILGGFSKIVYGVSDSVLTEDYQHLWKSSFGLIQIGSTYLQLESIENREKISKERKEDETKRIKLSEEKLRLEKCEQNKFEDVFKEIDKRKKELCKQQCTIDNKCFCTAVAEKIMIDSIDEYQKKPDANLLAIMMGKTFKNVLKHLPMLLRKNITANKEEVMEIINTYIDGVETRMKPTFFTKLDLVFTDIKKDAFEYLIDHGQSQ